MNYEVTISQTDKGLLSNAEAMLELVKSEEYKKYNYVVTADNYDTAKKDKSAISKIVEEAKRKRIDFEKTMFKNWEPIKVTYMQAEKIVEGYIDSLSNDIKALEEADKKNKKKEIESYFIENRGELEIPFESVYDAEMLKKTCKKKKWQEIINEKVKNIKLDYKLLENSNVENLPLLQTIFLETCNRFTAFEQYEKQIATQKKADELQKQKEELQKTVYVSVPTPTLPVLDETETVNEMVSISGTKKAYKLVKRYAISLGVNWEEI